ncbi:hypothetical protein SASPL_119995 [Salvia splendens]|uniref:Uncharacterized protein n=1 Tax=Salvia splendens TaxID=180675 RepID=A0A8X8XS37_SALSN|nr:hypothetical protein SASPL_119995 [Salvia splendens]
MMKSAQHTVDRDQVVEENDAPWLDDQMPHNHLDYPQSWYLPLGSDDHQAGLVMVEQMYGTYQGSYQLNYNSVISGYIRKDKLTNLSGVQVKLLFALRLIISLSVPNVAVDWIAMASTGRILRVILLFLRFKIEVFHEDYSQSKLQRVVQEQEYSAKQKEQNVVHWDLDA